ncbi:phosphoribosylanthranilate isomerase [Belliella baltica DSM 15883]|uniref:phosphoribosylanthranilate isomerase n=1 Tax=Belliella baltica (strain DSM 15883 / CIP 108006 / LMG 21964 / BA134) TaxID=866536 RepID=I3Z7H8_BELBD|nr:phosphoribosylanthranilate isomerase [Belliella baltica]AFL85196.1 phosphoribosylanthranilate isomerase [Belliella baltica DSM 15883]
MSLKTFVKISAINNLSDARYCAGMYVNLMGFNLEENQPNYISPEKFGEITSWLSGLEYVGEFENSHPDSILETLKSYPDIKYIEIQEEIHLKMLVNSSYGLILKQNIKDVDDLEDLITKSQSYSDHDVTLHLVSETLHLDDSILEKIKALSEKCQVLLGFGLEANSIENIIEKTKIRGISLQGGDEIKPGLKDFDELADILEALEIDN